MSLSDLPTMAEVAASRIGKPIPKGETRLERKTLAGKVEVITDTAFKKIVRARDKMTCRKCLRKVHIQLSRSDRRAEVHHLYGRHGLFRHDDRFAILVCATCHEQLTGKVNERWAVLGTVRIEIEGHARIDARAPLTFKRVA